MKTTDGTIVCNKCGKAEADSDVIARELGWMFDVDVEPTAHICPECQEKAQRV